MSVGAETARKAIAVAACSFLFAFAMVPLYQVYCEITGANGRVLGSATERPARVDQSREVTVQFVVNRQSGLDWTVQPEQASIRVHPGQAVEVAYLAANPGAVDSVGHAVPSVAPNAAAMYLVKTECFCFTEQRLQAGETRRMPVRFYVDPDLPAGIGTLTLAYTFYRNPRAAEALARLDGLPDTPTRR